MTVTTTHTCDRCKKATKKEELYKIKLMLESRQYFHNNMQESRTHGADYCDSCLRALGIDRPLSQESQDAGETRISVEELIRNIAREEAQNVAEGN